MQVEHKCGSTAMGRERKAVWVLEFHVTVIYLVPERQWLTLG